MGGWVITASSAKPTTRMGHRDMHDADQEWVLAMVGGRITRSSVASTAAVSSHPEVDATEDAVIGLPTRSTQEPLSGQVVPSRHPRSHNVRSRFGGASGVDDRGRSARSTDDRCSGGVIAMMYAGGALVGDGVSSGDEWVMT